MEYQHSGHKIKLNHSGALPRYVSAIDIESERIDENNGHTHYFHRWRGGSIVSGRYRSGAFRGYQYEEATTREQFWRYLYSRSRPNFTAWVIGRNILSQLVLAGIADEFTESRLHIDKPRSKRIKAGSNGEQAENGALAVLESPPTIIGCRVAETQGRIVFVDILNWFPGYLSPDQTAEGFATFASSPEWHSNVSRRCVSSQRAFHLHKTFAGLMHWVKTNDMGLFRYTASSQAMGAYRHRFMEHPIYVHDNSTIKKLERRGYFGGRSDCFRVAELRDTVFQLDVAALFPSVMQDGYFPHIMHRWEQRPELLHLLPTIDWSASVAEVELYTDKPLYPVRTDLHVIYPTGKFQTVLCGMELQRAFMSGCICKVGSWAEYKLKPLFRRWVTDLWAMRQRYRQDGNKLYEQFTKYIMNSLYGKFAQLTPQWVNVNSDYSLLPFTTESRRNGQTGEWEALRAIGWQVQRLTARVERPSSFYAVAAFVTSAARVRMDNLRSCAGRRNCYYQGVDSLIINKWGLSNLREAGEVSDNTIGRLRLEQSADYLNIRGISDYQIGEKVVLSSRSHQTETNDLGDVRQHKWYIMQHLFRNGPIDHIEERLDPWERRGQYAKGEIQPDGWVEPFELGSPATSEIDGCNPLDSAAEHNSDT